MPNISFGVAPSRDHAFFQQPQFECLLGDNLLQGACFVTQDLHLVACRRSRCDGGFADFWLIFTPSSLR
jgi:hypothetical protein